MSALEQLQVKIASYFEFYGVKVADMLATFSGVNQRRITQSFMDIIEGELYVRDEEKDTTTITCSLPKDISKAVQLFVELYMLDKYSTEALDAATEYLRKINR